MLVALVVVAVCVAILFLCRGQNQVSWTALRALDGAFRLATDPAGATTGASRAERVQRNVTPFSKKIVAESGGWRCACGCNRALDASFEVDHIIPLSEGGTNHQSNLQALRSECHKLKTSFERSRR